MESMLSQYKASPEELAKRAAANAPLTAEQEAQYLIDDTCCPWCGGSNLIPGGVEVDAGGASQRIDCGDCGRSWWDIYKLTGIEEIKD